MESRYRGRHYTSLISAIIMKKPKIARRMIEEGADVNELYGDITPLGCALQSGHLASVQLLLAHGATMSCVDAYGRTALHFVCSFNNESVYGLCKLLVNKGADCNSRDPNGITPVLVAFMNQSLEVIQLLLAHGADVRAVSTTGETALHYAARNPNLDVLEFALGQGFDADCSDNYNASALHNAASSRNFEGCELLLRHGAMVDRRTHGGVTPLALSVSTRGQCTCGEALTVQVLLEYGATLDGRTEEGISVLESAARETGREETQKVLMWYMAKSKILNLSIGEENEQMIESNDCYKTFYQKCLQELENMKVKFYNNVSVFNILMDGDDVISGYAKNNELLKALEQTDYCRQFPLYFPWLKRRFYDQVKKQKLRSMAAEILNEIFMFPDPTHPGNQNIVEHLSDADLEFLCSNSVSTRARSRMKSLGQRILVCRKGVARAAEFLTRLAKHWLT